MHPTLDRSLRDAHTLRSVGGRAVLYQDHARQITVVSTVSVKTVKCALEIDA